MLKPSPLPGVVRLGIEPEKRSKTTTAVFSALWLTGVELNITALMSMTMVIGIATGMAIFYVSEYDELVCCPADT